MAPSASALAISLGLAYGVHRAVIGRHERSALTVIGSLAGMQAVLHVVLSLGGSHGGFGAGATTGMPMAPGAHSLHAMPGMASTHSMAGMHDMAGTQAMAGMHDMAGIHGSGGGLLMLATHVLAAIVLGILLRAGDAAFWAAARRSIWSLRSRLDDYLVVLLTPVASPCRIQPPRETAVPAPVLRRSQRRWFGGRICRGPPCGVLAI